MANLPEGVKSRAPFLALFVGTAVFVAYLGVRLSLSNAQLKPVTGLAVFLITAIGSFVAFTADAKRQVRRRKAGLPKSKLGSILQGCAVGLGGLLAVSYKDVSPLGQLALLGVGLGAATSLIRLGAIEIIRELRESK